MQVKFLSLDNYKIIKIFIFTFISCVVILLLYFPNYAKLKTLREEKAKLISEIYKLKKEVKILQEKLEKIRKDSSLKEKIARENLGVAKENEIVIDIQE